MKLTINNKNERIGEKLNLKKKKDIEESFIIFTYRKNVTTLGLYKQSIYN